MAIRWNLLHLFKDGVNETASGVQVQEDLEQAKGKIEAIEEAAPGTYSTLAVAAVSPAELQPSLTHTTRVILIVSCEANSSLTVFVGGKEITGCGSEGSSTQSITFDVPPAAKWKYTASKVKEVRYVNQQQPLPI